MMACAENPTTGEAQTKPSFEKPKLQLPGVYRFDVGDFHMTALSDGTVPQDLPSLLTNTTPEEIDRLLHRAYLTNPVEVSINVFVIEAGPRLVLVDTGAGELLGPGNGGKLVSSLSAAGFRPEQITDILITHAHPDHCGGLVVASNNAFVNATVHIGKPEVDFFLNPANSAATGYDIQFFEQAAKMLKPYVDAGQVSLFTDTAEVVPGITGSVQPGHTPGSAFFIAESQGETITFVGDIVHAGAVQFPKPNVTIVYDVDSNTAAAVREQSFSVFAQQRALVGAPHLPFPGIGHVRAEPEGGFVWVPVEYTNRQVN
jgi:glyoxylase-like metal-dependent hydrolase (beta-lactamase superfamily II)